MIEHRLIRRMAHLINEEIESILRREKVDALFIDAAVEFLKYYADKCHHGKEEDILFAELSLKRMIPEHRQIMEEIIKEHAQARNATSRLVRAKERYIGGETDALVSILNELKWLANFYPAHFEKEDKEFFMPLMHYFSAMERDDLIQKFFEFDMNLIHDRYQMIVDELEREKLYLKV